MTIYNPYNTCPEIRLSSEKILARMTYKLAETPWAEIKILDWLPEDDKLPIEFTFAETSFGRVLIANTSKGVCYMGPDIVGTMDVAQDFNKRFGYARCIERKSALQQQALEFMNRHADGSVILHLKGTPYQTEIWRKLLHIPFGNVLSYATLGGDKCYARAAGNATGRNPIFWIIPCHRVVNTSGRFDRYFWGGDIKNNLLAWEFANTPDQAETDHTDLSF